VTYITNDYSSARASSDGRPLPGRGDLLNARDQSAPNTLDRGRFLDRLSTGLTRWRGQNNSRHNKRPALLAHSPQPGRQVVHGQLMAALRAELVRSAHRAEAVAAVSLKLVVALRTEVEVALHLCRAGRAP